MLYTTHAGAPHQTDHDPGKDNSAQDNSVRDPLRFFWGGVRYPIREANKHFLVIGATGSGKTVTLRLLMQSVLPAIGTALDGQVRPHQALIYDAKQDLLSVLAGMNLQCPIVTLNPFDERGVAWDMAKDITAPAAAQQVAAILVPDEPNSSQPFFNNAVRTLLYGVLLSFLHTSPGAWTLHDVLLAMRSEARIRALLKRCPYTGHLNALVRSGTTFDSIMATITTKLMPYEVIAALWSQATRKDPSRKISLHEFLAKPCILVLGNHEENREAMDTLNRVLFKRLSQLVVAQPEDRRGQRRTWIFLDEVREAGRLDGLHSLLLRGRSKGACVVLGFQDIDGLRDVYGPYVAQEIVGQCAYKAILRLESPSTAEWAAQLYGSTQGVVLRKSHSQSYGQAATSGVGEAFEKAEVLPASEFMKIPPVRRGYLCGYYLTPLADYAALLNFRRGAVVDLPERLQGAAAFTSAIAGAREAGAREAGAREAGAHAAEAHAAEAHAAEAKAPVNAGSLDGAARLSSPAPIEDFMPRSPADQYLEDWRPEELKRWEALGLSLSLEKPPNAESDSASDSAQSHDTQSLNTGNTGSAGSVGATGAEAVAKAADPEAAAGVEAVGGGVIRPMKRLDLQIREISREEFESL